MIRIKRDVRPYFDKLRKYKVVIDDIEVGSIVDGGIEQYDIQTGHHTIYLKIDWCTSNKIEFDILENEILEFNCGSLKGKKTLLVYMYITILRNRYLWIKKVASV
jgi:hypothetical protein